MKTLLSISFFLLCFADLQAQFTKAVNLKTIQIEGKLAWGMQYRYGRQLLKDGYSLEIPFGGINNVEIKRQYRGFKWFNGAGNVMNLVTNFYFFYYLGKNIGGGNGGRRTLMFPKEYWAVWGGGMLASWGLKIAGRVKLKKAIDTYNDVIFMPEVGQINYRIDTPNSMSYGLKAVYRF